MCTSIYLYSNTNKILNPNQNILENTTTKESLTQESKAAKESWNQKPMFLESGSKRNCYKSNTRRSSSKTLYISS